MKSFGPAIFFSSPPPLPVINDCSLRHQSSGRDQLGLKANLHHWYLFNKGTHTGKVSFGSFHIQNYQFITMTGGAYILYTNTHYKKNQYLPWSTKWFILVRTLWAYGLYVLSHIRLSLGLGS